MKTILLFALLFLAPTIKAETKALCQAGEDHRELTQVSEIGRLRVSADALRGCTGFLVSANCVISAGHCLTQFQVMDFNLAASDAQGVPAQAAAEDHYLVQEVIASRKAGLGKDWAVLRLHPNAITGMQAGDKQGYFQLSYQMPKVGQVIEVIGFGESSKYPEYNYAQQSHQGAIGRIHRSEGLFKQKGRIAYKIDTSAGTSGAPLVLKGTQKVIGVHTSGGCGTLTFNGGSSVAVNTDFAQAIMRCQSMQ